MTTPKLRDELKHLYRGYVNLLETARERIIYYGGQCDPVEMMEAQDPYLNKARAALAAQPEFHEPVAHLKKNGFRFNADIEPYDYETEVKLYTAAQLQQAVEMATDKSLESASEWQDVERLAANRYRPVPDGFSYKVVAGDGTRSLWHGTQDECRLFAAKLTEAFLDGAFVQRQQAQAKREPMAESVICEIFAEEIDAYNDPCKAWGTDLEGQSILPAPSKPTTTSETRHEVACKRPLQLDRCGRHHIDR